MASTLFFVPTPSAQIGNGSAAPSGLLGSWGQNGSSTYVGSTAGDLSQTSGSSQTSIAVTASGATQKVGCMQFVSDSLLAGSIAGTINWGACLSTTGGNVIAGTIFIGLLTPTGTLRSTLLALTSTGTITPGSTETTVFASSVAITTQSASDADRLVVEIGCDITTNGAACTIFAGGATAISSSNAANGDAQSFVTFSQTLTYYIGYPPLPTFMRSAFSAPSYRM